MVHIDPGLVTELRADVRGRPSGLPLFPRPVAGDARLARSLRSLHAALTGTATPLEQHEQLTGTMALLTRHAMLRDRRAAPSRAPATSASAAQAALRIRDLLHDGYASPLTADDLAAAATAAGTPPAGRFRRRSGSRRATTSVSSGSAKPAGCWARECRLRRSPPTSASRTRRT